MITLFKVTQLSNSMSFLAFGVSCAILVAMIIWLVDQHDKKRNI